MATAAAAAADPLWQQISAVLTTLIAAQTVAIRQSIIMRWTRHAFNFCTA